MSNLTVEKIVFSVANETLSGCTPEECDTFRAWAKAEIESEYPGAEVDTSDSGNCEVIVSGPGSYESDRLKGEIYNFMESLINR